MFSLASVFQLNIKCLLTVEQCYKAPEHCHWQSESSGFVRNRPESSGVICRHPESVGVGDFRSPETGPYKMQEWHVYEIHAQSKIHKKKNTLK